MSSYIFNQALPKSLAKVIDSIVKSNYIKRDILYILNQVELYMGIFPLSPLSNS